MIPTFDCWKCLVILFGICQLTSSATFRCYKTLNDYVDIPINAPEGLLNASNSCIEVSKPTYLISLGYTFEVNGSVVLSLVPSLLNLGKQNVILLNWEKEAGDGGVGPVAGYALALLNCKTIGKAVGKALVKLVLLGLSNEIHMISHSLGAQLAGYTGRQTQEAGLTLTEIVALDPARLGFTAPTIYKHVDKTCAKLVTVVHCDAGGYALNMTLGHMDFWANFGNYISKNSVRMQPGCAKGESPLEKFTGGNSCSHSRCWQYYNVSLNNPTLFEGGKAKNYYDWLSKNGDFNVTNYLGPQVNSQEPGDFFFVTSLENPWGLGSRGLTEN